MNKIKVVVCRVGQPPTVESMAPDLQSMQGMVGGYIECVALEMDRVDRGVDLWCNEEGNINNLPPNRIVEGQLIHGDFFIAAHDHEGETISLTETECKRWLTRAREWRQLVMLN